jgi:hypothetical protein
MYFYMSMNLGISLLTKEMHSEYLRVIKIRKENILEI